MGTQAERAATVIARASWAWTLDADWNAGGWNVE